MAPTKDGAKDGKKPAPKKIGEEGEGWRGGEGTRGSSSESQKGAEEGGEGSSRHQGEEGPNQCEVLQATNLQARQGSQVPPQVHPQQEPHGCLQHHQAPLDHRVCYEEDRGQ